MSQPAPDPSVPGPPARRRADREVLRANPDDPAAHNNLGNSLMGLKLYPEAVASYSRAIELSPQFSFAQCNRAIALFAGEPQRERPSRSCLRASPMCAGVWAALRALPRTVLQTASGPRRSALGGPSCGGIRSSRTPARRWRRRCGWRDSRGRRRRSGRGWTTRGTGCVR